MRDELSNVEDDFSSDGDYGSPALAGLILAALFLSLLPIPVVALELLPTYTMHARFLIFYAPLVSFLVLGYLLYIREQLARIMFAGLLEDMAVAHPDPYYRESGMGKGRMIARRMFTGMLNLLPVILLGTSLYCVSRYVARFNDSVAIASGVLAGRIPHPSPADPAGAGTEGPAPETTGTRAPPVLGGRGEESPQMAALRQLPGLANDNNPLRTYTLITATIDDIPYFVALTAFYIGGITCALAAVLLVLLKEYARSTLGLSEAEVLGGRMVDEALEPDFEAEGASRPEA